MRFADMAFVASWWSMAIRSGESPLSSGNLFAYVSISRQNACASVDTRGRSNDGASAASWTSPHSSTFALAAARPRSVSRLRRLLVQYDREVIGADVQSLAKVEAVCAEALHTGVEI